MISMIQYLLYYVILQYLGKFMNNLILFKERNLKFTFKEIMTFI